MHFEKFSWDYKTFRPIRTETEFQNEDIEELKIGKCRLSRLLQKSTKFLLRFGIFYFRDTFQADFETQANLGIPNKLL